jgi:predicted ATPase
VKALPSHLLQTDLIENEIAALVIEKTEGVPFFVEEFVKSLRDLGTIQVQKGRCRLTAKAALHLPSSTQDIITARIDALIEIFRECGADGWVSKYEKQLASLAVH